MTVALVQAATTLPMFLFSLPAGALADIVDRRRLLIVVQIAAAAVAALFAILVWLDWVTPSWLLTFISLSGIATVLAMPSWQAILPQLVPKEGLRSAVALNGIGLNISRAIGPALAGLAIGALGMAAPYWVRGRGMAMFATVQFAGLAVGSIVWGQAAQMIGFPAVHIIAAIALLASVPLLWRWKLQTAAGLDLAPSMHWPAPLLSHDSPTEVRRWRPSNTSSPRLIARHFSQRWRSWRASAGVMALLTGASTKTPQKRVSSSRHSATTCDSINACPMPTGCCRMLCIVSKRKARRRSDI
ncbi:MAG: MFS transporter [Stellaceae bacterium]